MSNDCSRGFYRKAPECKATLLLNHLQNKHTIRILYVYFCSCLKEWGPQIFLTPSIFGLHYSITFQIAKTMWNFIEICFKIAVLWPLWNLTPPRMYQFALTWMWLSHGFWPEGPFLLWEKKKEFSFSFNTTNLLAKKDASFCLKRNCTVHKSTSIKMTKLVGTSYR